MGPPHPQSVVTHPEFSVQLTDQGDDGYKNGPHNARPHRFERCCQPFGYHGDTYLLHRRGKSCRGQLGLGQGQLGLGKLRKRCKQREGGKGLAFCSSHGWLCPLWDLQHTRLDADMNCAFYHLARGLDRRSRSASAAAMLNGRVGLLIRNDSLPNRREKRLEVGEKERERTRKNPAMAKMPLTPRRIGGVGVWRMGGCKAKMARQQ